MAVGATVNMPNSGSSAEYNMIHSAVQAAQTDMDATPRDMHDNYATAAVGAQ